MTDSTEEQVRAIVEGFREAWEYDQLNRDDAINDLHFRAGEQWDDADEQSRRNTGRPSLVLDKVGQYVRKIVNQMNAQSPSLRVYAADETGDPQMTDLYEGAIRDIEYASNAKQARINAHENQVTCGIGHYRVKNILHPTQPYQIIRIESIKDPLSVVWDPNSIERDRSDARYCYVIKDIPIRTFKDKFPDAQEIGFWGNSPHSRTNYYSSIRYSQGRYIRVAEYWEKYSKKHKFIVDQQGMTIDVTNMEDDEILGFNPTTSYERDIDHVRYKLVSGREVLEEIKDYPCSYIPIVPVVGEEIHLEDGTYRQGIVRKLREPQKLYNYMMSIAMEQMAQSVKSPYLVTNKMITGNEKMWRMANIAAMPFLVYTPDGDAPSAKPERVLPPMQHREQMMAAQSFLNDMASAAGMYDDAMGKETNAKSGVAIQARQKESEITTNNFAANFATSVRHEGRIILSMIKNLYTEERRVRVVQNDGTQDFVDINKRYNDIYNNEVRILNDVTFGNYEVRAELGASYGTIKQDSLNSLMELVRINPQMTPFLMPQIADLIESPNAEELKEAAMQFQQMALGVQQQQGQPMPPQQQLPVQQ